MKGKGTTKRLRGMLGAVTLFTLGAVAMWGCTSSNPMPWGSGGEEGTYAAKDTASAADCTEEITGWWGPSEDVVMAADDLHSQQDVGYWWGAEEVAGYSPPEASGQGDSSSPGTNPGGWDEDPPDGCVPSCEAKQCGPDGCGGTCGWCSAQTSCQDGVCVEVPGCTPECAGKMIGEEDGCGGVCSGGGFGIGLKPGGAQDVGYFRKLVADGQVPEAEFFPIEGFLNEHDTPLPPPNYDMLATLHAFVGLFYDPQVDEPLIAMQLGLNSGLDPSVITAKNFNLVVAVDTSGSMGSDSKMDFVKEGLILMLDSLDENDTLSIVTYDDWAKVELEPVPITPETIPEIKAIINDLTPGGSTNIYGGLEVSFKQAMKGITNSEAMHRVMMLSDGNATAGNTLAEDILIMSAAYNGEGIGITTIGVGSDFNFELMYGLANQGNGNFYFLEDGEKLVDVFQHELEYLMTPVAENLKISFTLPKGFFVEDIYGFDFETHEGGEVVLLGPSPQYKAAPPGQTPGGGPGDGGGVSVSTLFASKKNGLLMVKLGTEEAPDIFTAWNNLDFAKVTYSYELVTKGTTEVGETVVTLGSLSYFAEDGEGPLAWFSGPIMQRNFCILRTALAIRQACTLYNQDLKDVDGAVLQLSDATTFCNGINLQLKDPAITEDVAFMEQVKDNICTLEECMTP